jgi:hypothetical protein
MIQLSRRSKTYSIGKEIGGAVYMHRSYVSILPTIVSECRKCIDDRFDFKIVKYAAKARTVSFIQSDDFDFSPEPEICDLFTVTFDGKATFRKRLFDPYIYHHKWLFVRDDYEGFDVEESRQRSRDWLVLNDVDKKRIGRKSYWEKHVVPRIKSDAAESDW